MIQKPQKNSFRIFVTREISHASRDQLCQKGDSSLNIEWDIWPLSRAPKREELKERLAEADAAITLLSDQIDGEVMDSAPRLKIVANYAVGTNNIDLWAAQKRNIAVTNTPDVLTQATADLAFSLLLACARNLLPAWNNASTGQWKGWEPQGFLGTDLRGKTLGIIGMGRIGREMARLCRQSFQMPILYTSAHGEKSLAPPLEKAENTTLEGLLESSDVISLHCPLTEQNKNLLDAEKLKLVKEEAYIVNTARGGLIETEALINCLREGQFSGVALDVTEPEPLPKEHELYSFPRVLITPHIGSATHKARNQMADLCYENVLRHLSGQEVLSRVV